MVITVLNPIEDDVIFKSRYKRSHYGMDWPWPIWKRMIQDEVCQQQCEPRSLRRVGWWGKNWAMPLGAPKNGDLADCRGPSGCVLRRVLVELMLNIGLKGVLFGRTLPSWWKGRCQKTDGSDGKWKAPQMILDRFLIRTSSPITKTSLNKRLWSRAPIRSGPQLDKKAETIEKKTRENINSYSELRVAKVSRSWAASHKASSSSPQSNQVWDW